MHMTLKMHQNTYSSWKTGKVKNISAPFSLKFRDELGIELHGSMEMNKIVVSNISLFQKVFRHAWDNLEFSKSNSGKFIFVDQS